MKFQGRFSPWLLAKWHRNQQRTDPSGNSQDDKVDGLFTNVKSALEHAGSTAGEDSFLLKALKHAQSEVYSSLCDFLAHSIPFNILQ